MSATAEQNKTLVGRVWEAMNTRQFEALDDLVVSDVIRHCEATPGVDVRSLEQFKDFMRRDAMTFPDSVQTIRHVVAEENLVSVWATYEGTQQGPMGPFPPTGRRARFDFAAVFRVDNGKIAEWWVTWDNVNVLRALGHLGES